MTDEEFTKQAKLERNEILAKKGRFFELLGEKERELRLRLERLCPRIVPTQREELIARAIVTLKNKLGRMQGIQYLLDSDDFTLIKWIGETPAPFEI